MSIAEKLLQLRKNAGYSQEELAEKIFVTRQAISKWERGEALPDTENLIALSKLYNVSLDELFETTPREVDAVISTRKMGDSTSSTRDFGVIKFNNENTEQNHPDSIAIELPYIRLSSSETSRTGYYDYKSTLYIPVQHIPPTP